MANEKVKLVELVGTAVSESLVEAIKISKRKYKDLDTAALAEALGLTEFQFDHLREKVLGRLVAEKLENEIKHKLLHGDSIEIPHQVNLYVHHSGVRKNDDGSFRKKISVETRAQLKRELNKPREEKSHGKKDRQGRSKRRK